MDTLGNAIASFFARREAYIAVSQKNATKEKEEQIQHDIETCLDAVHRHLSEYAATLDRYAARLDSEGLKAVWDMRDSVIEVVDEYERLRIDHWLAFYLAIIDEDASSAEALPTSLEEFNDLFQKGKLCFRELSDQQDLKRRQCAKRTAEIYTKHYEIGLHLALPQLEETFF